MELKQYKNERGHEIVDCPFCKYHTYIKEITSQSPDSLRGLKQHIKSSAKLEALGLHFDANTTREHLDYYKNHTSDKIAVTEKRYFDDDMKLTNKK